MFPTDRFRSILSKASPLTNELVTKISTLEREVERLHAIEGPLARVGFSVVMSAEMTDIATGADTTLEFDTEIFDIGDNFNVATYTFTTPVKGIYAMSLIIRLEDADTAATWMRTQIVTSNRTYIRSFPINKLTGDDDYVGWAMAPIVDMDAADTAYATFRQEGGAAQTDIIEDRTWFMGWLIG